MYYCLGTLEKSVLIRTEVNVTKRRKIKKKVVHSFVITRNFGFRKNKLSGRINFVQSYKKQ